jgi:altronate dehydratase small subunit
MRSHCLSRSMARQFSAQAKDINEREESEMKKAIVMDSKDNVATLLTDVDANDVVQVMIGGKTTEAKAGEKIQFGHKFAMKPITKGQHVVKYGEVIGQATQDIGEGQHVHVHNVESLRGRGDLSNSR